MRRNQLAIKRFTEKAKCWLREILCRNAGPIELSRVRGEMWGAYDADLGIDRGVSDLKLQFPRVGWTGYKGPVPL